MGVVLSQKPLDLVGRRVAASLKETRLRVPAYQLVPDLASSSDKSWLCMLG